ncbi:MAG TPA: SDR family NAD(P)-dependent oxidoreductase, partial [Kineosporiaceae bacterium]|nr:SDR family NAD(P)-dependent oxidoreductase [Kineosporiaceae bacterium]
GARVVLVDLPGSDGEQAAAGLGPGAVFAPADVADEAAVGAALDAAEQLGTLRIVVNCAGVATPGKVLGRGGVLGLDVFERVVRVNLVGTFNVLRLAAARMAAAEPVGEERGVVVCTASVAAFEGQIGQAAYSASKAGVAGMTLPIARELASSLVRVVTIAPGLFSTPMLAGLPQEAQDSLGRQVPHPSRLGDPKGTRRSRPTSSRTRCSTARRSASTARSGWPRADPRPHVGSDHALRSGSPERSPDRSA